MAEQSAVPSDRTFRLPASAHEVWSLVLSLLIVFLVVQLGAPLIRTLDFIDSKLQDYAIGISFVAFPLIHRQCKSALSSFAAPAPPGLDMTPWFVSGALAATLMLAWNQFVAACVGFAIGLLHAQIPVGPISDMEFAQAFGLSMLAIALPMTAFAAVFAGILLNRYTRSHVFAALGFASLLYLGFNFALNFALQPAYTYAQIERASNDGVFGIVLFVIGLGLVAFVVLVFGAIGVAISRYNRERALGRIIDGARRLSQSERELLAAEVSRRLNPSHPAAGAPPPAAASFVAAASVPPAWPPQAATAAEP
jgi:hypothetical protein